MTNLPDPHARSCNAASERLLELLGQVYTAEGVEIWLRHADVQGWTLVEKIERAESLLGQVAT